MTALAAAPAAGRHRTSAAGSPVTGTILMLRTQLRVARWQLLGWMVGIAVLITVIAAAQDALYPTLEQRLGYQATLGESPVAWAFNGRGYDLSTLGGITAYEVGFMGLLMFPIVGVHLAIRLTRHEEEAGRTELLTAGRIGRLAPLTGAVLALLLALTGLAVLTSAGLVALGLPVTGSIRYAVITALFTGVFAAYGLVAAQVSQSARTAYLLGVGTVLGLFLVRAVIDGRRLDVLWPSPMNWLAQARPWGAWQAWPYLATLVTGLALTGLALVIAARRDLYAGLLTSRPGPTVAGRWLGTPTGLVWRLTRGSAIGWLLGMAVWGAALGSFVPEMADVVADNPTMALFLGTGGVEDLVIAMATLLAGIAGAVVIIVGVGHLGDEEDAGRFGLLVSTRLSRAGLWRTWWVVVVLQSLVAQLVAALALGAAMANFGGRQDSVGRAVAAAAAFAVPVLAIGAFAAAVRALAPAAYPLAWVLLGWALVVGLLADVLRLPQWARSISPFELVGNVPVEAASVPALVGLGVVSLVLFGGSVIGIARRDLRAG